MKIALALIAFLLLVTTQVLTQPRVSYMTPDIGAAGMNTYVEIVGPTSATGNFGTDGLYLNDASGNVRVSPATPADADKVIVGPIVVSWNGRMISAQVFVKYTATPGPVQLTVSVGAQSTTFSEFQIVTPQVLGAAGTVTGGGALGSGGTLGTRSKRGAMIVSSLFLQSGTYTVSTNDPDGTAPGNQGYLPFTLISKGPIALFPGASLTLNGTTPDAAAGGGGGGGNFCDVGSVGDNGGNGFTGGGAGGRNKSGIPLYTDTYKAPGQSTGLSGKSMNDASGGDDSCAYEGSGGGTGHPFGKGGEAWCGGASSSPTGQFGGGATCANGSNVGGQGGGGGYGSRGNAGTGPNASNNYGQLHGNAQGVPLAGGSGGGSGNPVAPFGGCAGKGGGGGGAIAITSHVFLNNSATIEAKGGNGESAGSGNVWSGGGGSGGYIGMAAKVRSSFGGVTNVSGGTGGGGSGSGGQGRFRYDGYPINVPSSTGSATQYIGVTTDTATYTDTRFFTLTGTYDGVSEVRAFMRNGVNPVWRFLGTPTYSPAQRSWSVTVQLSNLPPARDTFYFSVLQKIASPSNAQYTAVPDWVMSQASANIVIYEPMAKIETDKPSVAFADVKCAETGLDSVKVWNSGDSVLKITPSIVPPGDFVILPPHNAPFTVDPQDTVWVKIRFSPTSSGTKNAVLRLTSNDPRINPVLKSPTDIALSGKRIATQASWNMLAVVPIKTIDMGRVCKDSTGKAATYAFYGGELPGSIVSVNRVTSGSSPFSVDPATLSKLPIALKIPNDSAQLSILFHPTTAGSFADTFAVTVGPCNDVLTLIVIGEGIETKASVTPTPLDFGLVRINTTAVLPYMVRNIGASPGTITSVFWSVPAPEFTLQAPSLVNTALTPGQAPVQGNVGFRPTTVGTFSATLCIVFGQTCPDTVCIPVTGEGVSSLLAVSRKQVFLYADTCAAKTKTDTIKLYNRGFAPERITGMSVGNNYISVTSAPALPYDLAPNDSIVFTVTWTPSVYGPTKDSITITSTSADPRQKNLVVNFILQRDRSALTLLDANGAAVPLTQELDFGNAFKCNIPLSLNFRVSNTGSIRENNLTPRLVNGTTFSVATITPFSLDPARNQLITVRFNPASSGTFRDTLVIGKTYCNEEIRLPVVGNRYDLTYAGSAIAFDTVASFTTKALPGSVVNTSILPPTIKSGVTSVYIQPSTAPFRVVTPTGLPKQIGAGDTASVTVEFSPTAEGTFNASLCFVLGTPCADTVCIPLSGIGKLASGIVEVDIPDSLKGRPGDRIAIPVLLTRAVALQQAGVTTIRTYIRFRASLLLPTGARSKDQLRKPSGTQTGKIVSSSIQGQYRVMVIDFTNNPPLTAPDTLGVIDAVVALGDTTATPILVDSIAGVDGRMTGTGQNGHFSLIGYCVIGGSRLLQVNGNFGIKAVAPNPIGGSAEVQFETVETGVTSLVVYNAQGRQVQSLIMKKELSVGGHAEPWDASQLPSGVYYIELQTPTQRSRQQVTIVK